MHSHCRGRGFESPMLHQDYYIGFLYKEVFIYLEKYRTTLTGSFFFPLGNKNCFYFCFP